MRFSKRPEDEPDALLLEMDEVCPVAVLLCYSPLQHRLLC